MSEVQARRRRPRTACPAGILFDAGQLTLGDRQPEVPSRVEVGVLVDPVEDLADQLLEEDPRGDPDLAPEVARDGDGQLGDVGVVGQSKDPVVGPGASRA